MHLNITHLNPGSHDHVQSVLKNHHYGADITIHRIYNEGDDKIVEYDTKPRK